MAFTQVEKDLLIIAVLQSAEQLQAHKLRHAEKHKDTFDAAIKARNDLVEKINQEL